MKQYYDILEVRPGASTSEIKRAYYKKIREFPPDRNQEKFIKIRKSYEKLKDPLSRARLEIENDNKLDKFEDLLNEELNYIGPQPWLDYLKK